MCLQEVETEQYFTLFLETLKERGYDGYFCPKSRAKLVSEQERKHVDGCAVFFKTEKWVMGLTTLWQNVLAWWPQFMCVVKIWNSKFGPFIVAKWFAVVNGEWCHCISVCVCTLSALSMCKRTSKCVCVFLQVYVGTETHRGVQPGGHGQLRGLGGHAEQSDDQRQHRSGRSARGQQGHVLRW